MPELQSEAGSCVGSCLMSTSSYCGTVVADVTRPGGYITERLQLSGEDVSSLRTPSLTRPYSRSVDPSEGEANRPWKPELPAPASFHCGIDAARCSRALAGDGPTARRLHSPSVTEAARRLRPCQRASENKGTSH